MNKIYFLLMVLFLQGSCAESQNEITLAKCYFQNEYVNYAWGYQHSGFTVTPEGEVYTFTKSTPWVFAKDGKLSLADLKKNIAASVKEDTLISNSDIQYYLNLASSASLGKLSQPVTQGADMGGYGCTLFYPDPNSPESNYLQVILSVKGDIEQHNLAPEAGVIARWLENLRIH